MEFHVYVVGTQIVRVDTDEKGGMRADSGALDKLSKYFAEDTSSIPSYSTTYVNECQLGGKVQPCPYASHTGHKHTNLYSIFQYEHFFEKKMSSSSSESNQHL